MRDQKMILFLVAMVRSLKYVLPIAVGVAICLSISGSPVTAFASGSSPADRLAAHEPGPMQPFGSRNPEAVEEIAQYEFMIGEWRCDERFRQADGSWTENASLVRSTYFLNGHGIMNQTFLPQSAAAMTYQFVVGESQWAITNASAPSFGKSEWIGHKVGDTMIASRESTNPAGKRITLSITFLNIGPESFDWKLEATSAAGSLVVREKSCVRVSG
jgi:hypothetical protein